MISRCARTRRRPSRLVRHLRFTTHQTNGLNTVLDLLYHLAMAPIEEASPMSSAMQRNFHHPYEPYDIQKQFMTALYDCVEQGKVGIFESPTGKPSLHKERPRPIADSFRNGKESLLTPSPRLRFNSSSAADPSSLLITLFRS